MKLRLPTTPILIGATYAVAVFVLGLVFHPIVALTGEADNYIGMGRMLAHGQFPHDIFHPMGYPVAIAAVASVVGDYFLAAKLLSALAAGVLLWSVYKLASQAFSHASGVIAELLVGLHPYTVLFSMQATDTILSGALCSLTIMACVRAMQRPSWREGLLVGFAFGLTYWVRYSAVAIILPVGLAVLLPASLTNLQRLGRLAAFVVSAGVTLVPHFFITYKTFGHILYDENWRNLALSRYYHMDFSRLLDMPFDSWGAVFRHDPVTLVEGMSNAVVQFFGESLPGRLLGGGSAGWPEWTLYGFVLVGFLTSVFLRGASAAVGLLFAVPYLAAVVASFHAIARQVCLALPALLISASVVFLVIERTFRRWPRIAMIVRNGSAVALMGLLASRIPSQIRRLLLRKQPYAEYQAISRLVSEYGSSVVVYSPYVAWVLKNHVDFVPVNYPFYSPGAFDRSRFLGKLAKLADSGGVRFFVFGRASMQGRAHFEEIAKGSFPASLKLVRRTSDVLVLRAAGPSLDIRPNPWLHGQVTLGVTAHSPNVDGSVLGVKITLPGGAVHWLSLPIGSGGRATASFGPEKLPRGEWLLRPYALRHGALVPGQRIRWQVR